MTAYMKRVFKRGQSSKFSNFEKPNCQKHISLP
jgi:hypothetical protein